MAIRTTRQARRLRAAVLAGKMVADVEWDEWQNGVIGCKPSFQDRIARQVYIRRHEHLLRKWICTP